mmetsp:Transcript_34240/g.97067  ORF Transcript_34240/g.97067 Transcript_34240/m.97067 type:complete len:417 (-) Transcript_34240:316-1566(-)|eukprot:CAMPEP_0117671674 /NCGR_PEP_ID=MMETSP0804-20121206/13472_1 /TAXON_ID=1074897 /ORGANISM="Tetraselmis astigmatica, Strain CCMP880" /LENGTH=416 /DNA_ID=CAMNT_0005480175 /DNA_START=122 /DNA_END=1372 /DNA_ORIENTATION=-
MLNTYCAKSLAVINPQPHLAIRRPTVRLGRALLRENLPAAIETANPGTLISSRQVFSRRSPTFKKSSVVYSSWMPSMDPATLAAGAVSAAVLYSLYRLIKFTKSDTSLDRRPPPKHAFQGKVVWLVGASQGLGRVLAQYFSDRGARVILSARKVSELEEVALACGGKACASAVPLDITSPMEGLRAATEDAYKSFGGTEIDILVHIVGASQRSMAEETIPEVDEEMFAMNTLGPIRLTKAVLPRMLAAGSGHIAVISSMAGILPSPGQATYAATKHALQGFFKSLATEVCDRGVGVSLVCPGPVTADPSKPPRRVYGATGMVDGVDSGSSSARVTPERVAEMLGTAVYHNCPEVWVARHPVLVLAYVMRFIPALAWMALRKVGPKRARAVRDGRSGYDMSGIMKDGQPAADRPASS